MKTSCAVLASAGERHTVIKRCATAYALVLPLDMACCGAIDGAGGAEEVAGKGDGPGSCARSWLPVSQDDASYSFAGVAAHRSLRVAADRSRAAAAALARELFLVDLGSVAHVVDTCVDWDEARQLYRHYTLLGVNRAFVDQGNL